jgi:hypothetical protein
VEQQIKGTGAKPFSVLRIDELTRIGGMGEVERYYRHTIKTRGGTNLTVDIDEKDFTEDKVRPILEARAKEADKILQL